MESISKALSFDNRHNLFLPKSTKNNIFEVDLVTLVFKYPMLWSWLLDITVPEAKLNEMILQQMNVYGSDTRANIEQIANLANNDNNSNDMSIVVNGDNSQLSLDDKKNVIVEWAQWAGLLSKDQNDYNELEPVLNNIYQMRDFAVSAQNEINRLKQNKNTADVIIKNNPLMRQYSNMVRQNPGLITNDWRNHAQQARNDAQNAEWKWENAKF